MTNPAQLQQRVKRNREEREAEKLRLKRYDDRLKQIREAGDYIPTEFWCERCRQDFTAPGHKQVRFRGQVLPIAWHVGFCPKGHEAIRRITDKLNDPYYLQSEMLRRQRVDHADDFLQPNDPRFRLKYPKQWREMEEAKERAEQAMPHGEQTT